MAQPRRGSLSDVTLTASPDSAKEGHVDRNRHLPRAAGTARAPRTSRGEPRIRLAIIQERRATNVGLTGAPPYGQREKAGAVIEGYYPRIISEEMFGQAQQILKANRAKAGTKINPGRGEIRHMLAGLATCPLCGGSMLRSNKGADSGTQPRYVCSKALRVKDGCQRVRVNVSDVEKALIANADALAESTPSADTTLAKKIAATQQAFTALTEQTWQLATLLDETPSKTVMQKIAANEVRLEELTTELAALKARAAASSTNVIRQKVTELHGALATVGGIGNIVDANSALYACFSKVVIDYRSGELLCHWRRGPPPSVILYAEVERNNAKGG